MLKKILIANRGEIACRIIRTCRRLGIRSVAVYSEADRHAQHRQMADEAVFLGPSESAQSYLHVPRLLEAIKLSRCDALHPGYGFLSENADFVEAVSALGVHFIGPSGDAMRLLGDKVAAKRLAQSLKVPLAPSLTATKASKIPFIDQASTFATENGLPIIIKAAGGGGGRGMRVVRSIPELEPALLSAAREAKAFFGNDELFLEKLIYPARHIEVQIMGDLHGNVIHLWDRDCTFQRQHQKVLEEAPAPGIADEVRQRMLEFACALAKRAKYHGAGTVEFLLDSHGHFFFMEVNSRLQVEHPVSEAITGLDFVELQILIAGGVNLSEYFALGTKTFVPCSGSAIECRICAEVPEEGFIASTGKLMEFEIPPPKDTRAVLRVDTGFVRGDTISHYYDSLLAKCVVYSSDRQTSIAALQDTLARARIFGLKTNLAFVSQLIASDAFRLIRHHVSQAAELFRSPLEDESVRELLIGASMASLCMPAQDSSTDPWSELSGWRLCSRAQLRRSFSFGSDLHTRTVEILEQNFYRVIESDRVFQTSINEDGSFAVQGALSCPFVMVRRHASSYWIASPHGCYQLFEVSPLSRARGTDTDHQVRLVSSPLPGKIMDIKVQPQARVVAGETLLTIESMKMEHPIKSPCGGIVLEVLAKKDQVVASSAPLVRIEVVTA